MTDIKEQLASCTNNKTRKLLLKEIRRVMAKESEKFPSNHFVEVLLPPEFIGQIRSPIKAYRSADYLVQIYKYDDHIRISAQKTRITDSGDWEDGISWDQLMWIKSQVGYEDHDAVEVYPRKKDIVNVANIRHLFILNDPLPFIWRQNRRNI